jgi:hypothetical protein
MHGASFTKKSSAMQSTNFLFKALQNVCQKIHRARFRSLKAATDSLVEGRKLSLVGLGRSIKSETTTKYNIKRVDRLLGNRKLEQECASFYRAMSRIVLGSQSRPLILVDWSGLTRCGEFLLLRAATPVGGRAITLYEESHLEKDYDSQATNGQFLLNLKSVLPDNCSPIILTDAGFRNPWFKAVEALGWDWVGRVRNKTKFRWDGSRDWIPIKELYKQATFKERFLGAVYLAKANPRKCNLFLFKQRKKHRSHTNLRGHRVRCSVSLKHARREREPWLLASSLNYSQGLEKKIIQIYKMRMQIEESFRDIKNQRFGFAMSETRSKNKNRFNVLLLVGALASLAVWLIGKIAHNMKLQYQYQTNTIRKRNVLSLFFLGCAVYRKGTEFEEPDYVLAMQSLNAIIASQP